MPKPSIGVCIPSRGLMHSRTMQDILGACLGRVELGFYFAHGLPIPDSHNVAVEEALKDDHDYLFLTEDDMAYPYDILEKMLEADVDLAVADYPVGRSKQLCIKYSKSGDMQYAGLGCVLVKPWIFEKLGKPYFRTDVSYQEDTMEPVKAMGNHGLHDVDFWVRALRLSTSYKVVGQVGHYNLLSPQLPKYGNNTGKEYIIEKWL